MKVKRTFQEWCEDKDRGSDTGYRDYYLRDLRPLDDAPVDPAFLAKRIAMIESLILDMQSA